MRRVSEIFSSQGARHLLVIGAHSDDIEIGCGGTVLTMLHENPELEVTWVVLSADGVRQREANMGADRFLENSKHKSVVIGSFRDGYFPSEWEAIKSFFERLKADIEPDLIFTHMRNDLHQDHRVVSELTWNTFRDHLILEYEILKYDGDLGAPNVFVPLSEDVVEKKLEIIRECFPSQHGKRWFSRDTFAAMLRVRGVESNASDGAAESFYGRKLVL